jgi:predicted RNA binding protein YcfA (HicA-like mRNA interferase family)
VPKVREAIRLIEADGWRGVSTRGSHRQFQHPTKPGRVTVAQAQADIVWTLHSFNLTTVTQCSHQ